MPCVTHDLFVRDAVAVGGCHEPGAQAMRAERSSQRALLSSLGGKRPAPAVARRSGGLGLFEDPLYRRGQRVEPELQRVQDLMTEPGMVALLGAEDVVV